MGGGPDINYPAQPSYGEGMADALKAQVQLLTGTGDFASTGSLESLLPLEESIRKKTAQTDTDVLRQTLLGSEQKVVRDPDTGKFGIPGAEPVKNNNGKTQTAGGGRYQILMTAPGRDYVPKGNIRSQGTGRTPAVDGVSPTYTILDTETGGTTGEFNETITSSASSSDALAKAIKAANSELNSLQNTINTSGVSAVAQTFSFTNPNTGKPLQEGEVVRQGDGMVDLLGDKRNVQNTVAKPDFKKYVKDHEGNLFGQFEHARNQGDTRTIEQFGEDHYKYFGKDEGREVPVTYEQADAGRQAGFDESGNFLGLSAYGEDIQAGNLSRQRERDLKDVARLSGTYQDIMEDYKPGTQEALESARSVLEGQKDSLTGAGAIGGPQGITDPLSLTSKGFDAAQNTTAVDLTGNTSFTGAEVADPMSLTAKTGYDELADITGQKLTAGTSYTPTADVTGSGYTAAQAADPLALSAATSYDPSAGVTGTGYSAVAGLDGGRIEADSLRARLMKDAEAGLDQGLTDREERQIAEAARARSTMMGRTFDQSGTIAEAEARVAEDNARKMQSRAFAQSALGQEAGLQQSDLGRGLQAAMQNQAAQNQALQYSSGQDMQAQLANQAATNQALQAGMAAGLSQEALAAQQKQAQSFANQQASNRASEFGSAQALNAALANQQASNRAAEFGVQAGLGREQAQAGFAQQANLANTAAEQQRRESGLQAGLNQEQLQANMAQQKAMADAGFTQQASAMALEAGLTQEQAEAQLNQQRLMANQQFSQEANKYGAQEGMQVQLNNLANQISNYQFETGAQMDADRLNEQLKQSGILGYIQAAGGLAALEDSSTLDPFQAVLGRGGGGSLQAGQSVFGQAGYGLNSGPQYLNPESGLGYIQNQATNAANMYNANVAADATKTAGIFSGLGSLGGGLLGGAGAAASGGAKLFSGFCWVAREVYGEHNPAWLLFRKWMLNDSPSWFRATYIKYGERFANFISDKPRLKARIRRWMDSKIGR